MHSAGPDLYKIARFTDYFFRCLLGSCDQLRYILQTNQFISSDFAGIRVVGGPAFSGPGSCPTTTWTSECKVCSNGETPFSCGMVLRTRPALNHRTH